MIGSHDSYTYLRPRWWVMNLFRGLWRTQTRNVYDQMKRGVRYLDIRVRETRRGWRVCHGVVDLRLTFGSLREIADVHRDFFVRIILERGRTARFEEEAAVAARDCANVCFLGEKRGWRVLHEREPGPVVDLTFTPVLSALGFWGNLRRCWGMLRRSPGQMSISGWARAHPLPEGAAENGKLFFADRI